MNQAPIIEFDLDIARAIADQCICHPASRSVDDIERAGEAIKYLLWVVEKSRATAAIEADRAQRVELSDKLAEMQAEIERLRERVQTLAWAAKDAAGIERESDSLSAMREAMNQEIKLPPLPETEYILGIPARPYESEWISRDPAWGDSAMQDYATAAVELDRAQRGMKTIGTCSNCGGPVQVPEFWGGSVPPVPTCAKCGATLANPYGPVMPMSNPTRVNNEFEQFMRDKIRSGE